MSLNKFTHISLLKNDVKLKKVTNNHIKKSNHPKFFIKIKIMFQKKITSSKNKYKLLSPSPKKERKKKAKSGATFLSKEERRKKKMQLKLRIFI